MLTAASRTQQQHRVDKQPSVNCPVPETDVFFSLKSRIDVLSDSRVDCRRNAVRTNQISESESLTLKSVVQCPHGNLSAGSALPSTCSGCVILWRTWTWEYFPGGTCRMFSLLIWGCGLYLLFGSLLLSSNKPSHTGMSLTRSSFLCYQPLTDIQQMFQLYNGWTSRDLDLGHWDDLDKIFDFFSWFWFSLCKVVLDLLRLDLSAWTSVHGVCVDWKWP